MRGVVLLAWLAACGDGGHLPLDRLPRSTATAPLRPSDVVIVASADGVAVDGEPVPPDALGERLAARVAAGRAAVQADPKATFTGTVLIEVDVSHDAGTLLDLVAAAGQAGLSAPGIATRGDDGARHGIRITLPAADTAAGAAPAQPGKVSFARPTVQLLPDEGFRLTAADRVFDPGDGLVVKCATTPCGDAWPTVELTRLARRVKLDHAADRAVRVVPADDAPVQALVGALDATRTDALAGAGARELFPDAVLGRMAK